MNSAHETFKMSVQCSPNNVAQKEVGFRNFGAQISDIYEIVL